MGLLVVEHLQAVFEAAQKAIGLGHLIGGLPGDPFARGEPVQRVERGADAQVRLPPAGDELLRLHEEFDLADAAPPELQIMALDRDPRMALMRVDLPLHGVNVGDGGVVEIFPPDIGGRARAGSPRPPRCRPRRPAP